MKKLITLITSIILLTEISTVSAAQEPLDLPWQYGPSTAAIGDKATLRLPKNFVFLDAPNTKKFMEANKNIGSDDEYVIGENGKNWFAVFHFNPTGYVKDNETLDADAILQSVKDGTAAANKERTNRGWNTMSIGGWRFKPQYDKNTKLLEWAFVAINDETNEPVINYNTRLLGRTGVMEITLVCEPNELDKVVGTLKNTLANYEFVTGEKYTEFRQGDRVAEYGLAALIAGGAAAVAAKKGFFGAILAFLAAGWKFIALAFVGFFAWLKSLFSKK